MYVKVLESTFAGQFSHWRVTLVALAVSVSSIRRQKDKILYQRPPTASSVFVILCFLCFIGPAGWAWGNKARYEPGIDPGLGFNLVSWGNFGNGAQVWQNAVQSAHDAGFDDISLSPVRFYTPGTGSIANSSSSGPELTHIAAGVVRAKQLGMRVTVNPFVEPVGFSEWRGFYNPSPGSTEAATFWNEYEQYMVDVAIMAEISGADSVTVGTELRDHAQCGKQCVLELRDQFGERSVQRNYRVRGQLG